MEAKRRRRRRNPLKKKFPDTKAGEKIVIRFISLHFTAIRYVVVVVVFLFSVVGGVV